MNGSVGVMFFFPLLSFARLSKSIGDDLSVVILQIRNSLLCEGSDAFESP